MPVCMAPLEVQRGVVHRGGDRGEFRFLDTCCSVLENPGLQQKGWHGAIMV